MLNTTDNNVVKEKKKMSGFGLLNAILVIGFFFLGGILLVLSTAGITSILIIPSIIVNALLAFFYERYKQNGTMKVPMIVSRCIAVLMFVIVFGSPFIGGGFTYTPSMYSMKRTVFVYGVRPSASAVLPRKLPKNVSEYFFRTGLQVPAQDYHPYADLVFRCDGNSLSEYGENAEINGLEKHSPETTLKEYLGEDDNIMNDEVQLSYLLAKYTDVPKDLLYHLECEDMLRFAENAEVYRSSGAGCAFDRTTGYVIIWG